MYIDSGRKVDLLKIDRILNGNEPMRYKRAAYKAKQRILKQLHDKKLAHLREQLMEASRNHDEWITWKLTNQIKDYLGQEKMEWWSTKDERI